MGIDKELIDVLQEVVKELQQIAVNTKSTFNDAGSIGGNIIGAILAAVFGVLTALFLNYLKERGDKKTAAKLLYSQIENTKSTIVHFQNIVQTSIDKKIDYKNIVYSKLAPEQSFTTHRTTLLGVLRQDMFENIGKVYSNLKTNDDLMQEIIRLHTYSLVYEENESLTKMEENLLARYWDFFTSEAAAQCTLALFWIQTALEEYLGRDRWSNVFKTAPKDPAPPHDSTNSTN